MIITFGTTGTSCLVGSTSSPQTILSSYSPPPPSLSFSVFFFFTNVFSYFVTFSKGEDKEELGGGLKTIKWINGSTMYVMESGS